MASGNYDSRVYNICDPWNGRKGEEFERFLRDISAQANADDGYATHGQTLVGKDEGSPHPGAPPAIGAAAAALRRRTLRNRKAFGDLYKHIVNVTVKQSLKANFDGQGYEAMQWLIANFRETVDDLEITKLDRDWNEASIIADIGIDIDSPLRFKLHLDALNGLRPAANLKNDDQRTIKFLTDLAKTSKLFMLEANKEVRAPAANRQFMQAAPVGRRRGNARPRRVRHLLQ